MSKIVVFSAPSGSGKSTIINWLMKHEELNLHFSVSATSRMPRGEEKNGVEYFFFTPDEFREHIEAGDFLEYEEVYPGRYYGTLSAEVDKQLDKGDNVVIDMDVHGALNIKKYYGERALLVFVQPPSIEVLRQRLIDRGTEIMPLIEERVAKAAYELSFSPQFDKIIVNENLDEAQIKTLAVVKEFLGL
ncbi:MAG: guanylate kinase [Bacteroides sp.]|nr:guanylate kinase [Roseburia sp.]MCM1346215.1 guanylate kinase [Bacteroides sp.]MCM1420692.1 guanylate kinase [Bacteroides sp.]